MRIYCIKDFNRLYDSAATRRINNLSWIQIPLHLTDLDFRRLGTVADGIQLYGAWMVIIQLADRSKSENRGKLIYKGAPLGALDMAVISGFPENVFQKALDYFSQPSVGWLVIEQTAAAQPPNDGKPTDKQPPNDGQTTAEQPPNNRQTTDERPPNDLQDRTGQDRTGPIPPNPLKRGKRSGGVLPSEAVDPIGSRMRSVNVLKNRRDHTRWSGREFEAFKAAGLDSCSDDDFSEQIEPLQAYYAAPLRALQEFWGANGSRENGRGDYRRRDLLTLLNNWPGEVDRATAWCHVVEKKREADLAGAL